MDLKETLSNLNEGVKTALYGAKELKGSNLKKFKENFYCEHAEKIYFNEYNLIIVEKDVNEDLQDFFNSSNIILNFENEEMNCYLYVYQYVGNQMMEKYLS